MCTCHELTSPSPKEQALHQRRHPDGPQSHPLLRCRLLSLGPGEPGRAGLGTKLLRVLLEMKHWLETEVQG